MPRHDSIEQVPSHKVRELNRWWHQSRRDGGLPDRSDFRPEAWKPALPFLLLSDCIPEPFRIRYRLVGTAVVYTVGFDFTWRYLDDMQASSERPQPGENSAPTPAEAWAENYRVSFETRAPVYGLATVPTLGGDPFHYSYGIFPVSLAAANGDTATIRQFVGIEDYGAFQPRVQSTLLDLTIRRDRAAAGNQV